MCKYPNCKTWPNFNFEGEKSRIYCKKHKLEGMINITNKRCGERGCKLQPSYNFPGEKLRIYCLNHKKEGMIDVNHKTCKENKCKKRPSYNFPGEKPGLYCAKHMKEGMINVLDKSCKEFGCKKIPNFGKIDITGNFKAEYCKSHRQMIHILIKKIIFVLFVVQLMLKREVIYVPNVILIVKNIKKKKINY